MKAFSATSQPGKVQTGEAEQHQLQVYLEARKTWDFQELLDRIWEDAFKT